MAEARYDTVSQQLRHLAGEPDAALSDAELLERFCAERGEAVFAALVARHGPMVVNVCRRLLGNSHDADDAFQAVFALLAVKAATIRAGQALGAWLHTAAVRIASRARDRARRRGQLERQVVDMFEPQAATEPGWREVQPIVDEELERLPAKYRDPVVLRYLQGKNTTEAARELGCPAGSLTYRLSRALELLRQRLTRRGVVLPSAAVLATLLETQSSSAALPATLSVQATQAALHYSGGQLASVSPNVITLVEGALRTMLMSKVKMACALGLAACLLAAVGLGVALAYVPQDVAEKKGPPAAAKGTTEPANLPLEVRLLARVKDYKVGLTDQEIAQLQEMAKPQQNGVIRGFDVTPVAPKVDLVFEVKNTGTKPIELWNGGDPVRFSMQLTGPGAVTIHPQGRGRGGLFTPPGVVTIAPGKTYTLPITTLDEFFTAHYWTKPGEYTLTATIETAMAPRPAAAKEAPVYETGGGLAVAPNGRPEVPVRKLVGFGLIKLISAPVTVNVTK